MFLSSDHSNQNLYFSQEEVKKEVKKEDEGEEKFRVMMEEELGSAEKVSFITAALLYMSDLQMRVVHNRDN